MHSDNHAGMERVCCVEPHAREHCVGPGKERSKVDVAALETDPGVKKYILYDWSGVSGLPAHITQDQYILFGRDVPKEVLGSMPIKFRVSQGVLEKKGINDGQKMLPPPAESTPTLAAGPSKR